MIDVWRPAVLKSGHTFNVMMPEDKINNPEEKDRIKKAALPRVELRSEVVAKEAGAGLDKKWLWGVGAGMVILLIIISTVVAMSRQERAAGEEDGDKFGKLPEALDQIIGGDKSTSGLSGRVCAEAVRRPIGVMLSSDAVTRPVSGFADADMVWELPVLVSDVTRLLAVYQCGRPEEIGSIRSVRHDYLFLAEGIDAIIAHWGGSYHALNRINVGEFKTINALSNPFNAYYRKSDLPAPYNGFSSYDNLWNALEKLDYRKETNFSGYNFKNDAAGGERPAGGTLTVNWPGAFRVKYEYNPETNRYERFWGGTRQVEGSDKSTQIAPSTVAIMRAANQFAEGDGGYNEMDIEGTGPLEVYQDGQVIRGSWKKDELRKQDPVHFLDEEGKNIAFTRGQVWVMAVEPEIGVTWEPHVGMAPTGNGAEAGAGI